jgi:hypothetical protein
VGQTVALALDAVDVGVQLFEALAQEATPEALEQAAILYQGELLVVVTYRPEYGHGWASKSQYAQLRLEILRRPRRTLSSRRCWAKTKVWVAEADTRCPAGGQIRYSSRRACVSSWRPARSRASGARDILQRIFLLESG